MAMLASAATWPIRGGCGGGGGGGGGGGAVVAAAKFRLL